MVITLSLFAQYYQASDTLYIFARSGLNLRSEATAESKIVTKLKYRDRVTVAEVTEEVGIIEQREGRWLLVKIGSHQGYLFSGYLCQITPPPPPKDSLELNYHFVEWLESFTKKDSLVHSGKKSRIGFDPDGKDSYGIEWKFYASGTVIYSHIGYEWADYSFESMEISVNDLMNYLDFIAGYRSKRSEEGKIAYTSNNNWPPTFIVKNFYDIKVTISGNMTKVFIHLFDL